MRADFAQPATFERFDLGRDADGELLVVPTLSADRARDIMNGDAAAPPDTTVRVAGTFEHEGQHAMLVEATGPRALHATRPADAPGRPGS